MTKKVQKLLSSEVAFAILVSLIILFLSFYNLFHYLSIAPKNTVFPLFHNHPGDYNLYLHYMRQSFDGEWLITTRFTPENFPKQFVYPTYILLGKFARLTNLSLPITYNLSRVIFGILFLFFIYRFLIIIFPRQSSLRKLSFFLIVFGTGFFRISPNPAGITIGRFLDFWSETSILEKFAYIPHHLSAKVLFLISIILLYQSIQKKDRLVLFLSVFVAFLCGLSSPLVAVNLEITIALTIVLYLFLNLRRISQEKLGLTHMIIFVLISSLSLLYYRWVEKSNFPWTHYIGAEKQVFPIDYISYLYSLGPNLLFSIFALRWFFRSGNLLGLIIFSWLIEPIIGILTLSKIGILANVRFLSGASFIPLGIAASLGLNNLSTAIAKRVKVHRAILLFVFLIPATFVFIINIYSSLESHLTGYNQAYYNLFIPQEIISGFNFLNQSTPKETVVLSNGLMANLIPAHTHNKTVIGHMTHTLNLAEKGQEVLRFFNQNDSAFAQSLLTKYNISYVFYSLDTPAPDSAFLDNLGLKKAYSNPLVAIYRKNQ